MKTFANTATKILSSYDIVRQFRIYVPTKADSLLRYCLHTTKPKTIASPPVFGVVYFSGFSPVAQYISDTHSQALDVPLRAASAPDSPQEIIALCPRWLLISRTVDSQTRLSRYVRNETGELLEAPMENPEASFSSVLQAMHNGDPIEADPRHLPDSAFRGGLLGFIGYDVSAVEQTQTRYPSRLTDEQLDAAVGDYDIYFKREDEGWTLYGPSDPALYPLYSSLRAMADPLTRPEWTQAAPPALAMQTSLQPCWSKAEYTHAFERVQHYLRAGDCYQVNLTQPFHAQCQGDLLSHLADLADLTRAPYLAYMQVLGHELLSCSPELFVAFTGPQGDQHTPITNTVITRPIKGTYPRGKTPAEDAATRLQLQQSEKDQSENLMIVDLLRNDLGRHAKIGSVHVPKLFEIESFAQVHHLVSEIQADLRPDISPLAVLLDALPGGSITGAPKKRAMEIIAELEYGPRGAYCGSFGYLNADGSGQFNILIRTLQKYQQDLVIWAGGGITVASQVDAEYDECLHKIGAILDYFNRLNPSA